jgi:diguanylate cyclase (GGDEF)-like protein/PAS domain S-box-containing protein
MSSILTGKPDRLRGRVVQAAEGPVIVLLLFAVASLLPDLADGRRVHASLHILLLASGVFAAFFFVLFRIFIRHEEEPDHRLVLLASALLGMGLLDGLQTGYTDLFFPVLHALALFVGGVTLALIGLPVRMLPRGILRFLPWLIGSICLAVAILLLFFSDTLAAQEVSNRLRSVVQPLAVAGGMGFFLAWLCILRTHHGDPASQNRFLVNGSFLFSLASFFSLFPSLGDLLWRFHHLLLFCAYLLYIFFLLNSCRNEVNKLWKNCEELEAAKKKFSDVFDHSPSLIALQDAGGRFVLANEHFEKYFGLEQRDIIGRLEKEILPAHQKRVRSFEQLQETREYEETLFINNEKRVLATSRFPLTSCGQEKCGVGYIRTDITDRKELEYQLLLDQKILANTGEAVVVTDAASSIVDINRAYTRITGYEPKEIIGENPRICKSGHHDQAFYEAMWKELLETGKWSGEIRDRRKNGEVYQKWLSINAIYDNTGETINYVGIFTDITEKRKVEKQLKELLFYDPLTNLPNRTLFEELLSQALLNSQFHDAPLVLLCIDMSRFKDINDTLGYKAGDDLLVQVSKRIRSCVRETDTVSRLCGDEFMVLLSDIKLEDCVGHLARHLLRVLQQPFHITGEEVFVNACIGISVYPEDGQDAESLIRNADTAMNFAQKKGEGSYRYFRTQMNETLMRRVTVERELRHALEHEQFILYYQPKYDLVTGKISGAEALMRWRHPTKGIISPAEFIPVAEESSLILDIGEWGFREACRQVKVWQDQGLGTLPMAINLSSKQFQNKQLLRLVIKTLAEYAIKPEALELEITESVLMENPDDAAQLLRDVRGLGVRIAIDDFGTGYSSLAYLKKFPVNTLKIDQAFIADIVRDRNDEAIVASILSMAESLNLKVVAEGVETEGQLEIIQKMGCEEVQGYYFSRPLPAEGVAELLRKSDLC